MLRLRLTGARLGFSSQRRKELRCHHPRGALNHPLTDARNRATQLKISSVLNQRSFAFFRQIQNARTLQESRRTLSLNDNAIVLRWSHIFEPDGACEYTLDSSESCANGNGIS